MNAYIPVQVREEHVPQVYALLAELERSDGESSPAAVPKPAARTPADPDEKLVKRMYDESQDTHKTLLEHLAEHPDAWISSADLLRVPGLPDARKGLAGMFGAFGRRSKHRYGGARPWELDWDSAAHQARYMLPSKVAAWIKQAAY